MRIIRNEKPEISIAFAGNSIKALLSAEMQLKLDISAIYSGKSPIESIKKNQIPNLNKLLPAINQQLTTSEFAELANLGGFYSEVSALATLRSADNALDGILTIQTVNGREVIKYEPIP